MKAEIITFPAGGAQGLPVLRLDCEAQPFDLGRARALMAEKIGQTSVWGIWLERVDDWTAAELREFLTEQDQAGRVAVAVRDLAETVWPAAGCEFVLDASAAIAASTTARELALYLEANATTHPVVQDLIVQIEPGRAPPSASVLDMLAEFVNAGDLNYLYLPPDYEFRSLALRSICQAGSRWAIR